MNVVHWAPPPLQIWAPGFTVFSGLPIQQKTPVIRLRTSCFRN